MKKEVTSENLNTDETKKATVSRRTFIAGLSAGVAASVINTVSPTVEHAAAATTTSSTRRTKAKAIRDAATNLAQSRSFPRQRSNGEERDYPYVANYSKIMPHNSYGEVNSSAYAKYLKAIRTGRFSDWEAIPLGAAKKFKNPLAGLAYNLEGLDPQQFSIPPAPRIDGAENSAEMAELYWMALLRDVHFSDYDTDPLAMAAMTELTSMTGYKGPKTGGVVTSADLFRGTFAGNQVGPYVSQFLYKPIKWGSLEYDLKQKTTVAAVDFQKDLTTRLAAQNGIIPGVDVYDTTFRYIRNARDLANYVHYDRIQQSFNNAAVILLEGGYPYDSGNPYIGSATQSGFGTFDYPHLLSVVPYVASIALQAAWYQKFWVHRRLRPEEFGTRVHHKAIVGLNYDIDSEILNADALDRIYISNGGTLLLPLSYPEGCPPHPAYPSGHATIAGACVTVLKAWFNESTVISSPVVASSDGTTLSSYSDSDAGALTVGGELNKLACNIAFGRSMAGIHWRTDAIEGLKLGERVAIRVLQEQALRYRESHSFTITMFDGTTLRIRGRGAS